MRCSIPQAAKRRRRGVATLGLAIILTISPYLPANAQSVAGEGTFAANFVGYAANEVEPLQIGTDRFYGLVDSTLTAMNADNAAFLHNQTGRCLGSWTVDETAKTFEELVNCTYTDADGDQIFESATFDRQSLDAPHVGTGRWLGGTGKYEGLTGLFEIRTRTLRSAREGLVQYVGTKQGQYSLAARE